MLQLVNGRRCGVYGEAGVSVLFDLEGGCVADRRDTDRVVSGRALHPRHVVWEGVTLQLTELAARVYDGTDCDKESGALRVAFYARQLAVQRGEAVDFCRMRGRVRCYYWKGVRFTNSAWRQEWNSMYARAVAGHALLRRVADLVQRGRQRVYVPCLVKRDGMLGKQSMVTATRRVLDSLVQGSVVRTHRDRWRHELVVVQLLLDMCGLP